MATREDIHLAVDTGAGRSSDFHAVIGSVSSRRRDRTQLNFVAFDLLWLDGSWLVDDPQTDRRRLLERLHQLSDGTLGVLASFPAADLDDLLAGCEDLDLEGVVLKRSGSRYRPGRSRDWRKVKTSVWRSVHLPARQRAMSPPPAPH